MSESNSLFAHDALLPEGWAKDVRLHWDAAGRLDEVEVGATAPSGVPIASGPVIAGMPNLHSHAFQRGMAGLTEYRAEAQDSFWSWRTLMYRFALRISPEQLEAIAFGLYVDMLEAGYTSVCEFHYLHHDTDGQPYADDAQLSHALLRAASRAGIGLTLLPVLYQTSGFGALPPGDGQRRFIRSTDSMLALLQALRPVCKAQGARLGVAPHSLRAVPPQALQALLDGLDAIDPQAPIHIHIAEQTKEVDDCLAWSGQRPVAWLLDHAPVDARWCLVHATHMDADEYRRAAATGAVAGLCPSTEANLGDGLFDLPRWMAGQGRFGIGSDSHVCVDAAEELMLLEYGQRLALRQRNVAASPGRAQVAQALWQGCVQGGAQASGQAASASVSGSAAGLAVGRSADFVVLDAAHRALAALPPESMLAAHVFASDRTRAIDGVWSAGRPVVKDGRHALRGEAQAGFVAARRELLTQD
ncbi:formimidoylglutamate deiminase [Variovorax dokdonensis]|uniref:Formimidoylglutamate deiminase n=1 Tax=Variovorax dokdonensis TaxID=344883 RepID=A0ABT7NFH4_9BURK|nr:formimidoylglutamate deiminase [Variovorax dokdonensis]MDM0046671.1 formimidoylglutamate deiminase [Variovorax dokdonensis]